MAFLGVEAWHGDIWPDCEADIPVNDVEAWKMFDDHRWVYDRLRLAHSVGQPAVPCGIQPADHVRPLLCRPITDLTGRRAVIVGDGEPVHDLPGWFYQPLPPGRRMSTDLVVVFSRVVWRADAEIEEGPPTTVAPLSGSADTFHLLAGQQNFPVHGPDGYRGCVNVETIGGIPVDMRLCPSARLISLYPPRFADALAAFYDGRTWPGLPIPEGEEHPPQLARVKEGWSIPVHVDGRLVGYANGRSREEASQLAKEMDG